MSKLASSVPHPPLHEDDFSAKTLQDLITLSIANPSLSQSLSFVLITIK